MGLAEKICAVIFVISSLVAGIATWNEFKTYKTNECDSIETPQMILVKKEQK